MVIETDNVEVKFDSVQENAFNNFYRTLPEKLSSTIRFFDKTDYWTVHGADALMVAKEILKSPSAIKTAPNGKKSIEYVVVRKVVFEGVVRELLLVRQYRIEVYNKQNEWTLAYKASPGNLSQFEDLLYSSDVTATSGLMAVRVMGEVTGISYVDLSTYRMVSCEVRGEGFEAGGLEGIVVQLRPSECLLVQGGDAGVRAVMEKNGLAVTETKKGDFDGKNVKQDLSRLLQNDVNSHQMDCTVALSCLAASVKYLDLVSDDSNHKQFSFSHFQPSCHMRLDSSTIRSLNILPAPSLQQPGTTLFSVLNKCRTRSGQRLLSSWLHQPLTDVNLIEDRHDIIEAFTNHSELRLSLYDDLLRRTLDPAPTLRRLRCNKANLSDCYKLYKLIKLVPLMLGAFEGSVIDMEEGPAGKVNHMFVIPLKESEKDLHRYTEMIEQTVDLDKIDLHQEYMVRPDFDDALLGLQEQMDELEGKLKKELNKAALDLNLEAHKSIKLDSNSQHGFFLRITRKEEKALRGNEKKYKVIDANKGGVRFRTVNMQTLNQSYTSLKDEFVAQQKSVVAEVVAVAAGYLQPLDVLVNLLSLLDVFVSLSVVCVSAPKTFVRPTMIRNDKLRVMQLKGARHVCLERKEGVAYIPNHLNLSQDDKTMCIITGPNMGGKSTYIRSVGLIIVLAQIGCLVPCDEATMSVVDGLFARVGAGDDQSNGVSTFMAEMLETSTILKTATNKSFVIVDELGRGTSTYDGFGLAHAIAKHIAKDIGSMCLFASHFHELTSLADELTCVANLHAIAATTPTSLTLLYKIEAGICDQSFGIHVAEMVNFPNRVLQKARRLADNMEKSTAVIIGKHDGDDDDAADDDNDLDKNDVYPLPKKSKMTLEAIKSFIQKASSSSSSSSSLQLWQHIQQLKQEY